MILTPGFKGTVAFDDTGKCSLGIVTELSNFEKFSFFIGF